MTLPTGKPLHDEVVPLMRLTDRLPLHWRQRMAADPQWKEALEAGLQNARMHEADGIRTILDCVSCRDSLAVFTDLGGSMTLKYPDESIERGWRGIGIMLCTECMMHLDGPKKEYVVGSMVRTLREELELALGLDGTLFVEGRGRA